jgi:hypothetical protein
MSNRQATASDEARALLTKVAPKGKITNGADAYLFDMRGPVLMAALIAERDRLREALEQIAQGEHVMSPCATRYARNNDDDDPFECDCPVSIARAALSGKEGE